MKLRIPLFLFLISVISVAQEADTTLVRLQKEVKSASTDSVKINALIDLSSHQMGGTLSHAENSLKEALLLIKNHKNGINQRQLGAAYIQMGVLNRRKAFHTKAIDYYLKALEIFKTYNDSLLISDVYHNLGMAYRHRKNHDKAIAFYKKSIEIKKNIKDTHGLGAGYNMMGVSYRQSNKLDSALVCYDKAKRLFVSIKSVDNLQRVNNNLGALFREKGNYKEALRLGKESVAYAKRLNKQFSLCTAYYNLSTLYKRMEDFQSSLQYADSSLVIAEKERFRDRIALGYRRKSFLHHKMNNYKQAYFDYRIFNRHSDSIFNIDNIKKIQALELNHKFNQEKLADSLAFAQEKRQVALLAKAEASKKWLYFALFLLTAIAALVIGFLTRRNYKNKARILTEKLEKEQAQKALLDTKVKASEEETKRLIADNSMRLEFKQDFLNRLKNEIAPEASDTVKKAINALTAELEVQIKTEGKLSGLQSKIDEVNKGFDAKLRELYPALTKSEREMCALLRLNLSIKEIMTVRNASIDSVKSTRYRIRKKLGLSSGEELEKFIQNIS
ncbi:tetratricopeptide repeat protein [Aquimarina sp. D1M17]|uniref:tetratricopeptide repeat protein n=1 Tax=Aquimarina acroporae TaxID=2937283 RepID=UPI0020BE1E5D|nr:tetratricopeptide repeat protein [Aquimarina acroporae]MCK8523805.1 tetratricopeptide repeat protein [Aquimarina acroporae]